MESENSNGLRGVCLQRVLQPWWLPNAPISMPTSSQVNVDIPMKSERQHYRMHALRRKLELH